MKTYNKKMDIIIKMERQMRGNEGPNYSLTISGDGNVIYEGRRGMKINGESTTVLDERTVQELVNDFMNLYFFDLEDKYGETKGSNLDMATLSLKLGERKKTVLHIHGSRAPSGLLRLEDTIDKVTNSKQWTGL